MYLTWGLEVPILATYQKDMKTYSYKNLHANVYSRLINSFQNMKTNLIPPK